MAWRWVGKSIRSFVGPGGEVSSLKLGFGLSGGVLNFSWKPAQGKNYCFWGQMCVLASRLELKWSQDKPRRKVFTCFVYVLMMYSDCGWSLEEGAILFILAEGLKISVFWHYQVEKAVCTNPLWTLCTLTIIIRILRMIQLNVRNWSLVIYHESNSM